MSLLEESSINNTAVDEWLPWGGITRPAVMEQKDHSYFSVISYLPWDRYIFSDNVTFPEFRRGWGLWSERQHTLAGDYHYLALFWNPFTEKNKSYVENSLGERIAKDETLDYFEQEVQKFTKQIRQVTVARLLTYQEIMDFLSFSLSMGDNRVEMPEDSSCMDVLLSQDIKFRFDANDIYINDKRVLIVTLPGLTEPNILFDKFANIPFRYVHRLLMFNQDETKKDLNRYAGHWCSGRKTMLKRIEQDIFGNINGYYYNGFIFHVPSNEYDNFRLYVTNELTKLEIPFIIENYNLKDVWWGSIAGNYLANITPPLVGFSSVTDLLIQRKSANIPQEQRFQQYIDAMGREGNLPNV